MRLLLLSVLLTSSALAQSQAPYEVAEGDRVRLRLNSASAALVEGRVTTVSSDSLALALAAETGTTSRRVAWRDVGRLERQGENRTGEAIGIAVGLVVGAVVGGVIAKGIEPHSFAYAGGVVVGGFFGMPVGAVVGANARRPWVPLPRVGDGGPSVSFRVTLPLR